MKHENDLKYDRRTRLIGGKLHTVMQWKRHILKERSRTTNDTDSQYNGKRFADIRTTTKIYGLRWFIMKRKHIYIHLIK